MLQSLRHALVLLTLVVVSIAFARPPEASARPQAHSPDRILVVHSYNQEYSWTQHINKGVQEALRGLKLELEFAYLDAKRRPDPEGLRQRAAEVMAQIKAKAPRLVIAVDDAAQAYLVEPYLKGLAEPQVIFCGVNAPLKRYGFPAANVSGVRERWHFGEGFALLKKVNPKLRTLVLLTDDSESSGYVLEDLRLEQRQGRASALKLVAVEKIRTFQAWQRLVQRYNARVDAFGIGMFHSLVDETTGLVVPPEKVMAWTHSVLKKPTLGFADYAIEHGLLCGVLEAGKEQGQLAGQMARQVLERKIAAGRLPLRINERGVVLVNLKAAERLGVNIPFDIIKSAGVVIQ